MYGIGIRQYVAELVESNYAIYGNKQYLSCFYNYKRSCILVAEVRVENRHIYKGGKHLHFQLCEEPTFISINEMANLLRKQHIKAWINKHEPLSHAIGTLSCEEVDFENENKLELNALDDLFESLKDEKRIHLLENMNVSKPNIRYALNLILKAAVKDI